MVTVLVEVTSCKVLPSVALYITSNVLLCASVLSTAESSTVSIEPKSTVAPASTYTPNRSSIFSWGVLFDMVITGGTVSTTFTVRVAVTVVFPSYAVYTTSNEPIAVFCTLLRSVFVNSEPKSTVAPSST